MEEFFRRTDNDAVLNKAKTVSEAATNVQGRALLVEDWIPVEEELPEPETEVEITYEIRFVDGRRRRKTCRAIYEDGNIPTDESIYEWHNGEFDDDEFYDEAREDYFAPEGWYGSNDFMERFVAVDSFVIAWRPVAEPYENQEINT